VIAVKEATDAVDKLIGIVVVEDSVTQAEVLKRMLMKEGYAVSVARNGVEGLAMVKDLAPDLVLSDILMPEMSGFELCSHIKNDGHLGEIPVILLTSLNDPKDVIRGLECKADNFITKPYDEKYLLSRIRYILLSRELHLTEQMDVGIEIYFAGQKYHINSDRQQILNLLLSTYETAVRKNNELLHTQEELKELNEQLEKRVEERTSALIAEIEERKKAEKDKARLAAIVESTDDAIIAKDLNGVILNWNAGAERLFGYRADEVLGKPITLLLPPELGEEEERILRRLSVGERIEHYETVRLAKDGRRVEVSVTSSPIKDIHGRIVGASKIARDITERKRADEALRLAYQRLQRFVDANIVGIVIASPDGRILEANDYYLRLLGFTREDLESGKVVWRAITPPEWLPADEQAIRDLRERGSGTPYEKEYVRRDGVRVPVLLAVTLLPGPEEQIAAFVLDLTEHRKLEAQLRQAQKMESIGTLAGGIAHDFNNILTAIIGFGHVALMQMGPDDPQRENIGHMLEGADRAAQLTKDLLIFSRIEVCEKRPVDLNEIIGKVEKFLERVIGEDIACNLALHSEPIVVSADPHQLEQVLMNLATNARDAMKEGGEFMIGSDRIILGYDFVAIHGYGTPGKYALLTISDTGEGMDEETRRKIFDPFYTTKEVGKGTGLGLAVVYGIIKEHEGFISVYSEPGRGTTFNIYLPVIASKARGEVIIQEEETSTRGTETILLAEDDESVRRLLLIVLKQHGYQVIEAVDGADAVKKSMENRETIDLLLSDLIMPKMNGQESFDEMKAWRPKLKAIFMSGYAPDFVRRKMSLECGLELINKPILPGLLLKKIRNLLDKGER
jgi:two-component system cell cycle sensor histidine kinase/response regulator CckA